MAEVTATIEDLEHQLTALARRIEITARHRNYPLERAHYIVLLRLADGPLNVSALAEALELDSSTVTRQVAAMQRLGYVEKRPDPADGRGALIASTPAGRKASESMRDQRRRRIADMFGGWEEADRRHFTELLARANAALAGGAAGTDRPEKA